MKEKKYFILLLVSIFLFIGNAYAAEDESCPLETRTKLRQYASNVQVTYVPEERDAFNDEGEYTEYILVIKIFNLDSTLMAKVEDQESGMTYALDYRHINEDGAITFYNSDPSEIRNLTFYIYSSDPSCNSIVLRTIRLTMPKYNYFSEREICEDIPEYYLCQRYVTYDIDDRTFLDNVNKYKDKKTGVGENSQDGDNTNVVSRAISGVSKYRFVIAGVIIAIGISITVYVIRKKRSTIQ